MQRKAKGLKVCLKLNNDFLGWKKEKINFFLVNGKMANKSLIKHK
jgi:hypothetical protein